MINTTATLRDNNQLYKNKRWVDRNVNKLRTLSSKLAHHKFIIKSIERALKQNPPANTTLLRTELTRSKKIVHIVQAQIRQLNKDANAKPLYESRHKKYKPEKLDQLVLEFIQTKNPGDTITVEETADYCQAVNHEVKQSFHRFNLNGKLSQAFNEKHYEFDWIATRYYIL